MCDLTMVMKCEWYVFNLVINWWCEYLFISLWWWFEIHCIYLNNWMRIHMNMILLKMNMCIYDVVILILYIRSYFLYVEFISYPTCGKWSPTPLWCRLVGWGRIVSVSFPRTTWSLLVFYRFDFGVLTNGALIRTVGILFMLSDLRNFEFILMMYLFWDMMYDIYVAETYFRCDLIFYDGNLIYVERWRVTH